MNKSSLRALLSLSWHSVAYGIGILGSQLIIYVTLPFLTRYMPREEYGVIAVITALYALLNTLTNAGLPAATYRFYADAQSEQDKKIVLGGSQFLFLSFAVIPAALILIFPAGTSTLLLGSDHYGRVLQAVAGLLMVDTFNSFGTVILRVEVRALTSSIHSIILIACKTALALLFVIRYDMGVFGYWLGQFIGEFIGFLIMAWLVRRSISFQLARHQIWELLKFGMPLMPAMLSTTILKLSDRYIVGWLVGLEQAAIYDVGYKIGSLILILVTPFRAAWMPFAFSISQKPEASRIYRDVLTYLTAGCSFMILTVYAFRVDFIRIMAPDSYVSGANVVGLVAISNLFYTAYLVFSIGPMIGKKTQQLAWIAVSAGLANLLLNFVLIPIMGILGAAIATFVGYGLLALLALFKARQSIDIRIDLMRMRQLALTTAPSLLVILTAEWLAFSMLIEIALKIIGLLLFPALVFVTRFVKLTDLRELINMGRNMMGKRLASSDVGAEN